MEPEFTARFWNRLESQGERSVIDWVMSNGLIADRYECPNCKKGMKLCAWANASDRFAWRCRDKGHGNIVRTLLRHGSWFSNSNLTFCDILLLTQFWIRKMPLVGIAKEVGVSGHTVTDWVSFCREVCVEACVLTSESLGGVGKIVEIDESKFGKRKYHRGKRVEGKWVFGGIERGSKKSFFRVVENRGKEVLLAIIKELVLPGTTIISDCWKSYDCLEEEGFHHLKVNHSIEFKHPETGAHTNTIEGTWSAIKRSMPARTCLGEEQFNSYLFEYMWRRSCGNEDKMKEFLNVIKIVYPPQKQDLDSSVIHIDEDDKHQSCNITSKSKPLQKSTPQRSPLAKSQEFVNKNDSSSTRIDSVETDELCVEDSDAIFVKKFKTEKHVNPAPSYPIYAVLKELLAKENRQVDYIIGDGNCFFRAISKIMYGNDAFHKAVRNLIVDIIATYKLKFAQFVDGENVQVHVERMSEDHCWATTCEIYAAATLLQRDIYMFTPNYLNDKYSWLLFQPVFKRTLAESELSTHPCCYVTLCNTNGNHFDRIVPDHGGCNCFLPQPQLDGICASVDLTSV